MNPQFTLFSVLIEYLIEQQTSGHGDDEMAAFVNKQAHTQLL